MNEGTAQLSEVKSLPQGWRWVKLGEVCEFAYGTGLAEHNRVKGSVPVYGSNGVVGYHDVSITNGPTIIIGRKGSIGETHYSDVACWPIDTTYYVDTSKTSCDLQWLFSLLKWLRLDVYNRATGVPGLNRKDAYSQVIPLPPLPEQKRIAAKIQGLMAEVERAHAACEARLEAAKVLPKAYLRQIFESEEAKKWERRRLGELFNVQQGAAMSPYRREGISPRPFLRTLNVLWGRVDLSTVDKMDFTDEEVTRLSLEPGDLLVCEGGEVGRTAIWKGEIETCLYQNHIHRLRKVNDTVVPEFYMYWMQVAFQIFRSYSGEESITTIPNLSGNRLKSFSVPLPPTGEQKRIVAELQDSIASAERLKTSIEKELENIKALPQAILRKAFS